MTFIDDLVSLYCSAFKFFIISTVLLTVFKKSWGWLPRYIAEIFAIYLYKDYQDEVEIKRMFENKNYLTTQRLNNEKYKNPFEISTDLLSNGIETILQDDLKRPFKLNLNIFSLLKFTKRSDILPFYIIGFFIRWFFIFPLRCSFVLITSIFLLGSGFICILLNAEQKYFRYCGITFAKFFNISTGLIVTSHDTKNRPKFPGLAVSNHISANDVMTIYSDCDYEGKGYTITAQSHGGIVHFIEKFGGYLTPVLLLNRASGSDRSSLLETIIQHSKENDKNKYPILLFPEGYCSNNECVLQFRKAVFDGHVDIYPIAIKQNSSLCDAFWSENTYLPYLLRMMTSWCSIIDIFYLPPMRKMESENEEDFARRVQMAIADRILVDALPYDGGLKKEKEQDKYRTKIQNCIAEIIKSF